MFIPSIGKSVAVDMSVQQRNNTNQKKEKPVTIVATYYDYDKHVLQIKIKNNSSKTVKKVGLTIFKKDVSGYNYGMYDTFQYKRVSAYLDLNLASGCTVIKEVSVYIDNDYKYHGTYLEWARDNNNQYIF